MDIGAVPKVYPNDKKDSLWHKHRMVTGEFGNYCFVLVNKVSNVDFTSVKCSININICSSRTVYVTLSRLLGLLYNRRFVATVVVCYFANKIVVFFLALVEVVVFLLHLRVNFVKIFRVYKSHFRVYISARLFVLLFLNTMCHDSWVGLNVLMRLVFCVTMHKYVN